MVDSPKPSDIPNVFGLSQPQHMLSKLLFEIFELQNSLSVWTKSGSFPEPLFIAFNTAVTAWHITDWLWESAPTTRALMSKRFKFNYNEWSLRGRNTGLHSFQGCVVADRRALYICREIANASKHMRRKKADRNIRAVAEWHQALEAVGHVKVGDLLMDLAIFDGEQRIDAQRLFIDALGYWENLLKTEGLVAAEHRLPDRIIRAAE